MSPAWSPARRAGLWLGLALLAAGFVLARLGL